MTGLVRKATLLTVCGSLAAASAFAAIPSPANCTVPCAIVLVGDNGAAADQYGEFTVVVKDATNSPLNLVTVTVDFSGCCPGIRLSNTQRGVGVSHVANSAVVTGSTDISGTVTFRIEGAATGLATIISGTAGCATIIATGTNPPSAPITLTDGLNHPTVLVAVPDLDGAGAGGHPGVDVFDLSFWVNDKNAGGVNAATYRQRSDFDFHLPVFSCVKDFTLPDGINGFGVKAGDLSNLIGIKNSAHSLNNGPFPATCP